MNLSGINRYSSIASYTVSKPTEKSDFKSVLQDSQKTDTFTRTLSPVDTSIAETQAKLDKVAAAGRAVDYSGMTKTEIYAEIENRYKEAFDDFYTAASLIVTQNQLMMNNQFRNEVKEKVGGDLNTEFRNEARGYGDMTYDEIEATIKEKYAGKTSFNDQLNLYSELFSCGVLSNKYGAKQAINMSLDLKRSIESYPLKTNEELSSSIAENTSPFDMLLSNESITNMQQEFYRIIIEDILFGTPLFVE